MEIVFIVSGAGPMQVIWNDAAAGLNDFVRDQKKLPGRAQLTLVLFDHVHELIYDGSSLDEVKPLHANPYTAGGDNAVLDAVGKTIGYVRERLGKTPEGEKPGQVVVVVLTDGHDRASSDFTYKEIAGMIGREQRERGWKFFLATSAADPPGMAGALSIEVDKAYRFEPTGTGIRKLLLDLHGPIAALRAA